MKKRFLGLICFLYAGIIVYSWISSKIDNFLAPNMQLYLKVSVFILIIMGLILSINNKVNYRFKISDLILILPLVMLVIAGDGNLTMSFASNRVMKYNNQSIKKDSKEENKIIEEEIIKPEEDIKNEEIIEELPSEKSENITDIYFDIVDENYDALSNYLTYELNASYYEGKTIRVKGFTILEERYIPKGYFAIGKYLVSCCTADASFTGFFAKTNEKVENNKWYELEGILEKGKDPEGYDIMTIRVINIKEIDSKDEKQYVYPCYSYDNGSCEMVEKYHLK